MKAVVCLLPFMLIFLLILADANAQESAFGLSQKIVFLKSDSHKVEAVYFSRNLAKVILITKHSTANTAGTLGGQFVPVQNWLLFHPDKSSTAYFSKGFSSEELKTFVAQYRSRKTSWFFQSLLGTELRAAEKCNLRNQANPTSEILNHISLERTVENCDIELGVAIKDALKAAVDVYTDFSMPAFSKIAESFDSLKYALTTMASDLVKVMGPLVEKVPKVAEALMCEIFKKHAPGLAMTAVLPGGVRKLPFRVLNIIEDVRSFMKSPHILKLITDLAGSGRIESFVPVFSRLSHVVPDRLHHLKITSGNLDAHFERHRHEFPDVKTAEDYKSKISAFAKETNAKIIHYCPEIGHCGKLNVESGDYLVVSDKGQFVSFYKMRGDTKEQRFENFLIKSKNHAEYNH